MVADALAHQADLCELSTHVGCNECPGGKVCTSDDVCDALGYQWPLCPVAIMRSLPVRHIVEVFNQSKVSPLSGWPDDYAAYIVDGVVALEAAINKKVSDDMKRKNSQTATSPSGFWKSAGVR